MEERSDVDSTQCAHCSEHHSCGAVCVPALQGSADATSTTPPQLIQGRCAKLADVGQVPLCFRHYNTLLNHQDSAQSLQKNAPSPGAYSTYSTKKCRVIGCTVSRLIHVALCKEHDEWLNTLEDTRDNQYPPPPARCLSRGCRNLVSPIRGNSFCSLHQSQSIPEEENNQMPPNSHSAPPKSHHRRRRATDSNISADGPTRTDQPRRNRDSYRREPHSSRDNGSVSPESPKGHRRWSSGPSTYGRRGEERPKSYSDNPKHRKPEIPKSMPPRGQIPDSNSDSDSPKPRYLPPTPPRTPQRSPSPDLPTDIPEAEAAEKLSRRRRRTSKNEETRTHSRKTTAPKPENAAIESKRQTAVFRSDRPATASKMSRLHKFLITQPASVLNSSGRQRSSRAKAATNGSDYSPPPPAPRFESPTTVTDETLARPSFIRTNEGSTVPSKSVKFDIPESVIPSKPSSSKASSKRSSVRRR